MGYSKLEKAQAIIVAARTGRMAQDEIPVVAEEYRHGSYLRESVTTHLDFFERHNVTSNRLAISSLRFALCGYDGCAKVPRYDGLLLAEERRQLSLAHLARSSSETGRRSYQQHTGLHALPLERRIDAGKKSAIARGLIPWENKEIEDALALAEQIKYGPNSSHPGLPKWGLIAELLNSKYHSGALIRTSESLSHTIYNIRKKKRNLASNE